MASARPYMAYFRAKDTHCPNQGVRYYAVQIQLRPGNASTTCSFTYAIDTVNPISRPSSTMICVAH